MQIFGSKKFALTLWALALCLAMHAKAEEAIQLPTPPGMAPVIMTEKRLNFFMSKPGFSGMIGAVARVNKAMRVAAENPMDEWRRIDVRNAIAAMPAAITGLAGEFMQGNLHDGDFSAVQSMLGGFVDVSAADAYNKFLQKPDASLIPKAGSDFPGGLDQGPVASGSVSMDDNGSGVGDFKSEPTGVSSGELVDLRGSDLGALTREVSSSQGSNKLVFDDSAKKESSNEALANLAATNAASDSFLVQAVAQAAGNNENKKDSFLNEISRDLAAVEGQDGKKKCTPELEEAGECEEKEDDEYFRLDADKKKKKRTSDSSVKEKLSKKEKTPRLKGQTFSLSKKVKPWRAVTNWSKLLLPQPALALNPTDVCLACLEQQAGFGRTENEAVEACVQQQMCTMDQINAGRFGGNPNGGGGGGGMSGGGGGGGQGAGIAAAGAIASSIAGAAAQIATASAAASADKFRAAAAAGAAVAQTAIQADATMHLSDNQAAMNGATVETAKDIILGREASALANEKMTLAAFANSQDLNRADAREDRMLASYRADKEFELSLYAMRGQFALQSYRLRAQAYTNAMNGGIVGPPVALSPSYASFSTSFGNGGASSFGTMGLMSRSGSASGLPSLMGASGNTQRGVTSIRKPPKNVMRGSTETRRFISRSPAVLIPGHPPTMRSMTGGHRDLPITRSATSAPSRAVVYSFREGASAPSTSRPIK